MKTQFDIDEYINYLTAHLRLTLTRDFGEEGGHIVDLLASTSKQMDTIFYWVANYPFESK